MAATWRTLTRSSQRRNRKWPGHGSALARRANALGDTPGLGGIEEGTHLEQQCWQRKRTRHVHETFARRDLRSSQWRKNHIPVFAQPRGVSQHGRVVAHRRIGDWDEDDRSLGGQYDSRDQLVRYAVRD